MVWGLILSNFTIFKGIIQNQLIPHSITTSANVKQVQEINAQQSFDYDINFSGTSDQKILKIHPSVVFYVLYSKLPIDAEPKSLILCAIKRSFIYQTCC